MINERSKTKSTKGSHSNQYDRAIKSTRIENLFITGTFCWF